MPSKGATPGRLIETVALVAGGAGNLAHITPGLEVQSTIILSVSGLLLRTRFDTIALPSLSFSTPMRCDVASSITLTWAPRIDSRLYRSGLEQRMATVKIGRAQVRTPVTHAHLVCRHLPKK